MQLPAMIHATTPAVEHGGCQRSSMQRNMLPGIGDGEAEVVDELGSPGLGDLEVNSNKLPANRSSVTGAATQKLTKTSTKHKIHEHVTK